MIYGAYKENALMEYQSYKEQTLKLMPEEIWSKCNEIEELLDKYLEMGEEVNGNERIYNAGICREGKSDYRKVTFGN